ncbi:MAG: undecaprenyl-phosphate glucose phosphotransferase [Oscillospiraceae bacterium]|nr:undecaprenyl-phosphate glucose phosphotransferase [Oscillospiraceae bacterium]
MIKENQRLINQLNVVSDGLIILLMMPVAFWLRFFVMPDGRVSVPFPAYMLLALVMSLLCLFTYAAFGMYQSFRRVPVMKELRRLWLASLLDMALGLSGLFVVRSIDFSRWTMALFFVLSVGGLSAKRVLGRAFMRGMRAKGYNQKHVIVLGCGNTADKYLRIVEKERYLGYHVAGYVAPAPMEGQGQLRYFGTYDRLEEILDEQRPDEVVCAVEPEDYKYTPMLIAACEKTGTKLAIIPFYSDYMTSSPQFDNIGGVPLLNIRRIPLDNWGNAFVKRVADVVFSGLLLLLTSPIMLVCAIGVKLSSPGPVIFRQERMGRGKRTFCMYKFRSMRINDAQNTGWSRNEDERKTGFGAFIRKFSLDELPQLFNVFKGDMSLVGPRPELPYYVERFKEEVPLYMVKHQVRPGITGWAQVNGLRGDTSIKTRIEYDLYYIEHWTALLDIKILIMTIFGGKFINGESLK